MKILCGKILYFLCIFVSASDPSRHSISENQIDIHWNSSDIGDWYRLRFPRVEPSRTFVFPCVTFTCSSGRFSSGAVELLGSSAQGRADHQGFSTALFPFYCPPLLTSSRFFSQSIFPRNALLLPSLEIVKNRGAANIAQGSKRILVLRTTTLPHLHLVLSDSQYFKSDEI